MDNPADLYPCIGVCMADPDSGYCLGCGRPPLAAPAPVAATQPAVAVLSPDHHSDLNNDPDSPA